IRVHPILRPAIGAAMLGVLGVGYLWLIQRGTVPAFYGNGYPVITAMTSADFYYQDVAHSALKPAGALFATLMAVGTFKALATCLTLGSGGSGGMFAPSMFIGAAVGGAMGCVVNALHWGPS